jgi:addiction module HigA family antidote
MSQMHNPCHPGEVLKEALSEISVTDAARRLGVGRVALSRLLNGATGISPEMALRLSKALGTSPEFWYGMQVNFDLWQAKKKFRGKVRPIIQASDLGSLNCPRVTGEPSACITSRTERANSAAGRLRFEAIEEHRYRKS